MNAVEISVTREGLERIWRLHPKVQKKVFEMLEKFQENPRSPALHYEPIADFKDDRARTLRVDQSYRAIIISPRAGNRHILAWVDQHDDAMRWAKNKTFDVHPVLGTFQIVDAVAAHDAVARDAADAPADQPGYAGAVGHLTDDDLISIGVPAPLLPSVRLVDGEESFRHLAPHLPEEARDALEWIIVLGAPLAEAKEFRRRPTGPGPIDREDFGPATETPDAKQRFVTVRSAAELEQILRGPLALWRIFLHPEQRRLVEARYNGPARVLGGAGTGKTVVAMHRAQYLCDHVFTGADQRVLFTTFSKSLAEDVRENLKTLYKGESPARIEVSHLHSWAVRFLKREGIEVRVVDADESAALWKSVIDTQGLGTFTKAFVIAEWNEVVQAQGVRTKDAYLRVSRRGRGGPRLVKKSREQLWELFAAYRAGLDDRGKVEFIDVIRAASEQLARRPGRLPYAAVVVDEAQDFGPEELKLLRAIVPPGKDDMFLVGDAHQRIHTAAASLSSCGIDIRGRGTKLRINYRTTHEIRQWATALLHGVPVDDLDEASDDFKGYTSLLSGPAPHVRWAKGQDDEVGHVTAMVIALAHEPKVSPGETDSQVMRRRQLNEVAILAPTNWLLDNLYAPALKAGGIAFVKVDGTDSHATQPGVRLVTFHRAKGLEFRHVVIAGLGDERYPHALDRELLEDPVAVAAHEGRQRSLLFVGATRARETLEVSGWGKRRWV